ncbi:MAG TPA: amino acid permease [Pirellulaceae bacterium]|nr:amino acid permease [Pirellulaceae bacterium]
MNTPSQPTLLRVLGPTAATAIVVGGTIGAGIFFKANVIAQAVGRFDMVLAVWIVCGVVSLFGALTVAELAAATPHAGGQYVYLRQAYGPLAGFLWGWGEFWVLRTGSIAALAVAFANGFAGSIFRLFASFGWMAPLRELEPSWRIFGQWTVSEQTLLRVIAISAIVGLTVVNVVGARWGGIVQNITTFLKAFTLVSLVVLPFISGASDWSHLGTTFSRPDSPGLIAGFAMGMTAAFWAYDGWANISLVSEEVRDPQRNLPLSLGVGTLILIALYLSVTTAYHLVMPLDVIAQTPKSTSVAALACQRMLGEFGGEIAAAAIMLSTFGALNTNLLCGPRVIFAMARDGLFIRSMGTVHHNFRTPVAAIVAEAGWAVVLILGSNLLKGVTVPGWVSSLPEWLAAPLSQSIRGMANKPIFDVLTDYVIFGSFIFYLSSVAAVFVLRRKQPDMPRPYKTLGYPFVPAVFIIVSSGFLLGMLVTSPIESIAGLAFIALGLAAHRRQPEQQTAA